MNRCRVLALAVILTALAGCMSAGSHTTSAPAHVRHAFIIMLENQDYKDTFGDGKQNPYFLNTLRPMGALLTQYHAISHLSLPNYIALISGQPASKQTEADCERYNDFQMSGMSAEGLAIGDGCVYPASVKTLPDQLEAAGLSWRGYMEDMGNNPARESASCGHPTLNDADRTQSPEAPSTVVPKGDQYAARHNPFVYFHSIIDSLRCATQVVGLDHLSADLERAATTPNLVFVTPNLCHDGHDGDGSGTAGRGCVNGEPGGLRSVDEFLQTWVPKILASPAYQKDGLLIVTFDESNAASMATAPDPASGRKMVLATYAGVACCNQQTGPNVTRPAVIDYPVDEHEFYRVEMAGIGGDRIGAVLVSPFINPGTVSDLPYNHYALLRSLEDLFRLRHLGFAAQPGLRPFGPEIFNRH